MNLANIFTLADDYLTEVLVKMNFPEANAQLITNYSLLFLSILVSVLLFYITRWILRTYVAKHIRSSKTQWDDYLLKHRLFHKSSYLIPAFFIGWTIHPIFSEDPSSQSVLLLILTVYKFIIIAYIFNAFIDMAVHAYISQSSSNKFPVKGVGQIVKLLVWLITFILIVSSIIDKNPLSIFAGLGAVSAILLLVFKDPILGFVGGIQLAAFDMVKEGDWISLPKYDADGTVIDISITTVKVKNWDNTISTIPTYALISDSVKNWRGMEESDGRRIKRNILLDMNNVKF